MGFPLSSLSWRFQTQPVFLLWPGGWKEDKKIGARGDDNVVKNHYGHISQQLFENFCPHSPPGALWEWAVRTDALLKFWCWTGVCHKEWHDMFDLARLDLVDNKASGCMFPCKNTKRKSHFFPQPQNQIVVITRSWKLGDGGILSSCTCQCKLPSGEWSCRYYLRSVPYPKTREPSHPWLPAVAVSIFFKQMME